VSIINKKKYALTGLLDWVKVLIRRFLYFLTSDRSVEGRVHLHSIPPVLVSWNSVEGSSERPANTCLKKLEHKKFLMDDVVKEEF
jgi:hypothetical protein